MKWDELHPSVLVPSLQDGWDETDPDDRTLSIPQNIKPWRLYCIECDWRGIENAAMVPMCPQCGIRLRVEVPPYAMTTVPKCIKCGKIVLKCTCKDKKLEK